MSLLAMAIIGLLALSTYGNWIRKDIGRLERVGYIGSAVGLSAVLWQYGVEHRTPAEIARDEKAAVMQAAADADGAAQRAKEEARDAKLIETCHEYARDQAVHRSTVSFEREQRPKINSDGSAVIGLRFKVKNTYGLELTYGLLCVVTADGKPTGMVFEVNG